MVQIPTINTEQVISTTITFTGQGYSGTSFLIDSQNEISVEYYAEE
jgi:expansin (peptidoglycan-binding protein)